MKNKSLFNNYIRVAAIAPKVAVADTESNAREIITNAFYAYSELQARVIASPELSITGYTSGDLFDQELLVAEALEGLLYIQRQSSEMDIKSILVVGLPLVIEDKLFNVAAVIYRGKLYGIVPKTYLPSYKEFQEKRWFASARDLVAKEVTVHGEVVPIGTDLIFPLENSDAILGIEICEDLWTPVPPSSFAVVAGANIVANLSASNALVGKADYRKQLIEQQSARATCGYIYAGAGPGESTTDLAFDGHLIIAENGNILCESERFNMDGEMIVSDIDLAHLSTDRRRTTSFGESVHEVKKAFRRVSIPLENPPAENINRFIDPHPFVPSDSAKRDARAKEIFHIQTIGLAKRLKQADIKKIILGLSGGLDSTLALLVAVKTFRLLGLPLENIHTVTMPGFGTTARTKINAWKLAEALGVSIREIDITQAARQHFRDIGHDETNQDAVFENSQARERTKILMDLANKLGGIVLGTGDLSEIALGWCTFNGDHISMYNVNPSVPKTLVKYLVKWVSEQSDFLSSSAILADILDTPISPELTGGEGKPQQKTEDLVGPYELHDFFLYHFVRWSSTPSKIFALACMAKFDVPYDRPTIKHWLGQFIHRFFANQWKRSVASDGPKVGSVSLSPRGSWRMPSDAEAYLWKKDFESIKL